MAEGEGVPGIVAFKFYLKQIVPGVFPGFSVLGCVNKRERLMLAKRV
jgi:hypothetical protein